MTQRKKRFNRNNNQSIKMDNIRLLLKNNASFQQQQESLSPKSIDNDSYFKNTNLEDLLNIEKPIKTLQDLIDLGNSYDPKSSSKYVINLQTLHKCVPHLIELNNMVGLDNIKNNILNFVFYYLQNFDDENSSMKHTILEGHPGTGKTQVAKILAKLYYTLGLTKNDKFFQYSRSDLIGKYLGHTAIKTQECFDKAKGGVIFIDEAYALGNPEGKDSFSKECIDTINQNLTEMKSDIILIIAGYKEQLNNSFFYYNPGLYRRFPFRFNTGNSTHEDLKKIFELKVKESKWIIQEELPLKFFEENRNYFKYNGGDMETLFYLTKISHSKNVFGKEINLRKHITFQDLKEGFELFLTNDEVKSRSTQTDIQKYIYDTMFV